MASPCRTAALGGHRDACISCGLQAISYNSCRNRHCPKCQTAARDHWIQKRQQEPLPVGYFHLVFSVPHELVPLMWRNRRQLFSLLFEASAATLLEVVADPKHLGAQTGFLSILHTWGQTLTPHPHIHCVVPGGGLAADHSRWIASRSRFLLPVKVLNLCDFGHSWRETNGMVVSCPSIIAVATGIGSSLRCELEKTPTQLETQQEVGLWLAAPQEACSAGESVCTALLAPDELARARAFRFEADRQVYLTTRALVRLSLSHYHGGAPNLWRFKPNSFGKPETDPACGLRFNVAHTRQLVVCLVSRGIELGVDAEGKDRADEIVGLAEEVFSLTELEQLRALQEDERRDRALTLWTLKEAYVKALGKGMSFPLKRVSFMFGSGGQIRLDEDTEQDGLGGPWQFCTLDHAAHRIAVVIERAPGRRLTQVQLRSPAEIPVVLADGHERWFQSARE